MQLRTFQASTMAQCMAQVKSSLGSEAVILHMRQFQRRVWMGLRRVDVVEITAGVGLNVPPRRRTTDRPVPRAGASSRNGDTRALAAVGAGDSGAVAVAPGKELLGSAAAGSIVTLELTRQIAEVKTAVLDLVRQVRQENTPEVPEELFDHYRLLLENEVAGEIANEIVRKLKETVRPEHLHNAQFVREKIAEHVEKLVPTAGPIVRTKPSGPHVVALIGPTGVGKTTTIAKLAAHLKLREHHRVGVITMDTYRIAAVDQLKRYAEILSAPLRVVNTPEEMNSAVAALSDNDFILIDTAGRSPKDTLKIAELRSFLSAASVDEVHLVLSSTMNERCVDVAVERFGEVHFEKVIFTKLDEACHVGVVLNVIRRMNKALSYITTGQAVPSDIEIGRGRRLAQMILEKSS